MDHLDYEPRPDGARFRDPALISIWFSVMSIGFVIWFAIQFGWTGTFPLPIARYRATLRIAPLVLPVIALVFALVRLMLDWQQIPLLHSRYGCLALTLSIVAICIGVLAPYIWGFILIMQMESRS